MNPLRKLASQTAIYGLSSIVGRLLNYLLVPLHTRVFLPEEYGVVTEMYSYVAFLLILLTYGFETAYFRFAREESDRKSVYSTSLLSILTSSLLFVLVIWLFSSDIANWIRYPEHPEYIVWFALILAADAITAIPFASLRIQNKAFSFVAVRLINIGVNILVNLVFLWLLPTLANGDYGVWSTWADAWYNPNFGVGYVFVANLAASLITLLILLPGMRHALTGFSKELWMKMMRYSFPLMIGGLAGMTNEMFSRVILKYQLPADVAMHDLGVFGACYKVSVLMTIFIQTFRFAAEPFFFSQAKEKDSKHLYAQVMTWFVIACSFIYLGVMLFMNVVRLLVGEAFYEGLDIVPVLLMANLFLGIFYNLSIWFKLNDKTHFGAWLAIFGAVITIVLNFMLIPPFGYLGAAWATLIVYFSMMLVSWALGKKYYPIPYELSKILIYPTLAVLVSFVYPQILPMEGLVSWIIKATLFLLFLGAVWWIEVRKKTLISPQSPPRNFGE